MVAKRFAVLAQMVSAPTSSASPTAALVAEFLCEKTLERRWAHTRGGVRISRREHESCASHTVLGSSGHARLTELE